VSAQPQPDRIERGDGVTTPILLVGAGRSGTNLFASTFEKESNRFKNLFENRYIWSYGQRDMSCDVRRAEDATPRVASYIRRHFDAHVQRDDTILVDKTPSNALRIPFVAAIYPDLKVINIVRDGRDNIVSRTRQWEQRHKDESINVKPGETLSGKVRILADRVRHMRRLNARGNLPLNRIPRMATDMAPALAAHLVTGRPRRYAERVPGLPHILKTQGLDVAAAVQWREVVMAAVTDGRRLGSDRYLELHYESFLDDPVGTWSRIMDFIDIPETGAGGEHLAAVIRPSASGTWREGPDAARIGAVEAHIRPTLEYLGYEW